MICNVLGPASLPFWDGSALVELLRLSHPGKIEMSFGINCQVHLGLAVVGVSEIDYLTKNKGTYAVRQVTFADG